MSIVLLPLDLPLMLINSALKQQAAVPFCPYGPRLFVVPFCLANDQQNAFVGFCWPFWPAFSSIMVMEGMTKKGVRGWAWPIGSLPPPPSLPVAGHQFPWAGHNSGDPSELAMPDRQPVNEAAPNKQPAGHGPKGEEEWAKQEGNGQQPIDWPGKPRPRGMGNLEPGLGNLSRRLGGGRRGGNGKSRRWPCSGGGQRPRGCRPIDTCNTRPDCEGKVRLAAVVVENSERGFWEEGEQAWHSISIIVPPWPDSRQHRRRICQGAHPEHSLILHLHLFMDTLFAQWELGSYANGRRSSGNQISALHSTHTVHIFRPISNIANDQKAETVCQVPSIQRDSNLHWNKIN